MHNRSSLISEPDRTLTQVVALGVVVVEGASAVVLTTVGAIPICGLSAI